MKSFHTWMYAVLLTLIVSASCGYQADMVVPNGTGAEVRADVNNAIHALSTLNAGPAAPTILVGGMFWADTTANILKVRNATNDAWLSLFPIGTNITATAAEINKLAGTPAGLTSTELGYVDGAISNIQSQINGKVSYAGASYIMVNTLQANSSLEVYDPSGEETVFRVQPDGFYLKLRPAPASATTTCAQGEMRITDAHLYYCPASNTWVRAALSTWP